MTDINHVAAIALQNEVAELPGAQEDYDALREAALAKDQAAIDKASLKIFARSPDLTIESIDDAVSKGNDLLQNA